ncbi:LRP5 [Cordylochernes scorpioides]|uniref:LRP5 n=1 Tax=Cordylochernes scorpioides TaxID=51811 RepID=A0ABY6L5E2_9ARAC|nr:LRP5 [Cordylochernes scorpioides]
MFQKRVTLSCDTGPEPYLLFANRADIRRVGPAEYSTVVTGQQNVIALDVHLGKGLVFWSDITADRVRSAPLHPTGDPQVEDSCLIQLNGSELVPSEFDCFPITVSCRLSLDKLAKPLGGFTTVEVRDLASSGLVSPGGLAVDWSGDLIFWTDSGMARLEVSRLDGSARRVLVWRDVEKPRAVAVHPGLAALYWTDWGTRPRIERAAMDASRRAVLVDSGLFWPNGLTVDYPARRLYWADAKHHVIESVGLDGRHRRRVLDHGECSSYMSDSISLSYGFHNR